MNYILPLLIKDRITSYQIPHALYCQIIKIKDCHEVEVSKLKSGSHGDFYWCGLYLRSNKRNGFWLDPVKKGRKLFGSDIFLRQTTSIIKISKELQLAIRVSAVKED